MITNIHTVAVAIRRHLLAAVVLLGMLFTTQAKAQQIYSPGLGLGGGVFALGTDLAPALQIDLGVGYESYGYAGTRGVHGMTPDELMRSGMKLRAASRMRPRAIVRCGI